MRSFTTLYVRTAELGSELDAACGAAVHVMLWLHAATPLLWSRVRLEEALSELEGLVTEARARVSELEDLVGEEGALGKE